MSFNDWYDKNYSAISAMNTGTRGALEYLWDDVFSGKVKMSCTTCAYNGKFRDVQSYQNFDRCNKCHTVLTMYEPVL